MQFKAPHWLTSIAVIGVTFFTALASSKAPELLPYVDWFHAGAVLCGILAAPTIVSGEKA